MKGLQTLLKNLRVLADEAEAIRAKSARLGIQLSLMADQIESALGELISRGVKSE